jgi:nicotinate-nucleotide pyrophosphorylase (carboxylating)
MKERIVEFADAVRPLVELALTEDVAIGDVTTEATVDAERRGTARIVARESGVLAGLGVAEVAFRVLDPDFQFEGEAEDGTEIRAGKEIAHLAGRLRAILTAERVALNFLGRLSGIATATRRAVGAVAGSGVRITDTRKTTPGMRLLEKYAVAVGGGANHRQGLFDMFLVKDNHIAATGSLAEAVRRVRQSGIDLPLEVECDTLEQVREALALSVPRIMLDNLRGEALSRALGWVADARSSGVSVEVEISGRVTLETLPDLARDGVDFISIGSLTHSVRALDFSLEVVPEDR